jgi:hypothetical protein
MNKQDYANYIQRNKKGKKPPVACRRCGVDHPNVIEMHHVDGRNNSDWVEPLCKNCHAMITAEQNKLSPKVRSSKASSQNKRAFNIISIGALLREAGTRLINLGWEMIVYV